MLPDFDLTPMRGVFFGVEATLYSFTLSQRFLQVNRSLADVRKSLLPSITSWMTILPGDTLVFKRVTHSTAQSNSSLGTLSQLS